MRIAPALPLTLRDYHPRGDDMRAEILAGLHQLQKSLPCKYFYDERGSALFEAICELPEYYLTRTELGIMQAHAADMAAALGPEVLLVEPGSGSSLKTRLLLEHLQRPLAYVPVDISRAPLLDSAARLKGLYPDLEVLPVCADFNQAFEIPTPRQRPQRSIIYFPGSTIGNFEPAAAVELLRRLYRLAGAEGALLIGFDLHKDRAVLERAYSDAAGVTAAFNLNLLERLNRELEGDFDISRFRHHVIYNEAESRIEMYLVSRGPQLVRLSGERFGFRDGEAILTEYSYKHSLQGFTHLAAKAGLALEHNWLDERGYFCVAYLSGRRG
jgi:dimethylhistidine N-methyltransferase